MQKTKRKRDHKLNAIGVSFYVFTADKLKIDIKILKCPIHRPAEGLNGPL
jgi:hypothetical protein